ncbi:TetR/AcrR family transcriptional regulator [Streptomyces sp. NPDC002667]|uniref:TetR/AcrR family transcriptional regulator n=1 Tax=unclassified Streptomyces TaxID=2593676 RepID=UPI0034469E5F
MGAAQRRGSDTKAEIRAVALELFTEQGYEATSLREIAERLGVTKAALYYHFPSKEDIVRSLFTEHLAALDELVSWARSQPPGPELRAQVIDRMIDVASEQKLPVMRFALANHHLLKDLSPDRESVLERLNALYASLTGPDASIEEALRIRMALLSVHFAFHAGQDLDATDQQITDAARNIANLLNPSADATRPASSPTVAAH